MTVDRSAIEQMAKFMMATSDLEGLPDPTPITEGATPVSTAVARPAPMVNDPMMKDILKRFYDATNSVVAEASPSNNVIDRTLRESLVTERTTQGARIGNWEIAVQTVGKRKLYDVVHAASGQKIASELLIYEAAHSLVRHLNEGGKINSSEVVTLLQAEQEYATAIHDMRVFKHHLTKSPNSPRAAIYEDRYGQAKRTAISARDRVEKLSESF